MDNCDKTYYALVWSTSLKKRNKNVFIQGELLSGDTRIPEDSIMLYGSNDNDVVKITKRKICEKISYDIYTMTEKVEYYEKKEEILIPRDVRIIIWTGIDTIDLNSDKYRIVSYQMFNDLIFMKKREGLGRELIGA